MEIDRKVREILTDYRKYAAFNLKIKSKSGGLIPFRFNKAQSYLHERIERQKERLGYVRAVVIKGRQQGISTYIGGRFYYLTTTNQDTNCFIFAHDASGTKSLFTMVNNYYDNADEFLRPHRGTANRNELYFDVLRSGYRVGTAGTGGLGRSQTNQLLHWSEVAFSPNQEEHTRGIMQTVPLAVGTEVILESTANVCGDYFHRMVLLGLSGDSDWMTVFLPWYWQEEYTKRLPDDFSLTPEEAQLLEMYGNDGLTKEHLNWRRAKLQEFEGDSDRFKKEYPFNVEEAFEISDENAYISSTEVEQAIKSDFFDDNGVVVMGVDPARLGGDEFRISVRKGRTLVACYKLPAGDTVQTSNRLALEINKYDPDRINIDVGGLGVSVYDNLRYGPYKSVVNAVNFGGKADEPLRYVNKRNEMYARAKQWLNDTPCKINLPEADARALKAELCSPQKGWDLNQRLKLEGKEDIKERLGHSPDRADSFVLTFADIVPPKEAQQVRAPMMVADTSWSPF